MTTRVLALFILSLWSMLVSADEKPIVGAIRWDAWTGGSITQQVERSLSPLKYQSRLPWFANIGKDGVVSIDGGDQTVMDQEIDYAADAGLDYWAFLLYPESSTMSTALGQYLGSSRRSKLRFCLILKNTLDLPEAAWLRERKRAIALLQEPGYQTVLGNRPLVYVFSSKGLPKRRLQEFIALARERELNPYYVFMGWHPAADVKKAIPLGFDAVSSYAKSNSSPAFVDLANSVKTQLWENAVNHKAPYIPLVTTGWDKRTRQDNPVSWEVDGDYHKQSVFPSKATPDEIASHLDEALQFVDQHRDICEANAVIIYAWNEYDEGGWLAPTRDAKGFPDKSRLEAIRQVLGERR
ncbi:glycoside hydrolase family 99-like domain-containing protein [Novipirellula artificiosorum]|nr:glycoside hydrolase family 99-like domain-containing protein [Novipirellula artificiosorum]